MTSYTPPVPEDLNWHPVYRANALLREALQSTTQSLESLETHYSVEQLSNAIENVLQGPVQITYPRPLAVRLDNLHVEEKRIPGLEAFLRPIQHAPGAPVADARDGGEDNLAETERDDFSGEGWDDAELALDETPPLRADFPLDPALRPREVHMHTLMGEFQRRQRSASLLVAVSVATAVVLAVGGFVLAASLASPAGAGPLETPRSTSIAWSKPASATPPETSANRATKGEPLALPAQSGATPSPSRQIILAASGRQIALGPLLAPSLARYLMIRGLPPEATLSAGRQSGGGAWMVKGAYVPGLTLTLGQAASGDYPVEVYILETGDGPQARRSFLLRVAPSDRATVAAPAATPAPAPAIRYRSHRRTHRSFRLTARQSHAASRRGRHRCGADAAAPPRRARRWRGGLRSRPHLRSRDAGRARRQGRGRRCGQRPRLVRARLAGWQRKSGQTFENPR